MQLEYVCAVKSLTEYKLSTDWSVQELLYTFVMFSFTGTV